MTTTSVPAQPLPRPYLTWLCGVTVAQLGHAVLTFALGWAAAGLGGTTAALVLAFSGLPRLVLLVLGGAIADRVGARRILIVGESALLALTVVLALALARFGAPAWLLFAASIALGTVTAFCLPATGSMPRRLVPDDRLTRALALRQSLVQVVLLIAAPLGGLLVGAAGLPAIAWAATLSFGVSLCVLVTVADWSGPTSRLLPAGATSPPRLGLIDGFRVVARGPGLRRALVITGAGAALILPVPSLLVPLLGRSSGWGPGTTGLVAGAIGVGSVCAALVVARRTGAARVSRTSEDTGAPLGTVDRAGPTSLGRRRPPASAAVGLGVSSAGAFVVAIGSPLGGLPAATVTVLGALVLGFGNGTFVARIAPLVLGTAPRTHLARVQALAGLAQAVPVMASNLVLGTLAEHTSPHWTLGVTAAGLAACAVWAGRPA
jgi:MFS family permease